MARARALTLTLGRSLSVLLVSCAVVVRVGPTRLSGYVQAWRSACLGDAPRSFPAGLTILLLWYLLFEFSDMTRINAY